MTKPSQSIRDYLNKKVSQEKIPGMIAAIASSKKIIAIGSAGIRSVGSNNKLCDNDLVHIGSCTKSMTALLIASLVSDGIISWETSIIQVFPDIKSIIHPNFHNVTTWQLLTHRGGIPVDAENWRAFENMEIRNRRAAILKENLKAIPVLHGEFSYSNLGYMIAAAMAEKLTEKTWEELIHERLFKPLKMKSAGFGSPGDKYGENQPMGHIKSNGVWQPIHNDNSEASRPAGGIHLSIEDWRKFLAIQLPGKKQLSLHEKDLKKLITPVGDYAGGWIVTERSWGKGIVLTHSGSNTMWFAVVWVAPNLDRAFISVTNSSYENSFEVCNSVIEKLIEMNQQKFRNTNEY